MTGAARQTYGISTTEIPNASTLRVTIDQVINSRLDKELGGGAGGGNPFAGGTGGSSQFGVGAGGGASSPFPGSAGGGADESSPAGAAGSPFPGGVGGGQGLGGR
ncbi:hypothetical protein LC609_13160 [Nostoc sp. XA013]|nr:hypothetical protein [Nostoc sp. XA013]